MTQGHGETLTNKSHGRKTDLLEEGCCVIILNYKRLCPSVCLCVSQVISSFVNQTFKCLQQGQ